MESLWPVLLALLLVNIVIVAVLLRQQSAASGLAMPLEHLTQAVQQTQTQAAVLGERMGSVERQQQQASTALEALGRGLAVSETDTKSLLAAAAAIRADLGAAQEKLTTLRAQAETRAALELRTAESVRRLEAIIAGTQTKGAAGENILEMVFAKLPPEWQVRNFRVGNRSVEFGLRLPNNLVLPIDSKWPATTLVERLVQSEDPIEQQQLKEQIERAVLEKAREVMKYRDPALTVDFGIAVVPDAVYDLCTGVYVEVFKMNVVLVSYSMFVPYLLLVFQTVLRTSQNLDLEKLQQYLGTAQKSVADLQAELEGRFARALVMLENSRTDMSVHVSKIGGSLTGMQVSAAPAAPALSAPREPPG